MAMPWCEFCAVEMLIFMAVCAAAPAMKPKARDTPRTSCGNFTVCLQSGIEGPEDFARSCHTTFFFPRKRCPRRKSHVGVVRPATALRGDPDDVLGRVLDVAGLA